MGPKAKKCWHLQDRSTFQPMRQVYEKITEERTSHLPIHLLLAYMVFTYFVKLLLFAI